MKHVLLAIVTMFCATSALAKATVYKGQYDNGQSCVITVEETAKGVVVGTGETLASTKTYVADKKIQRTYFKYNPSNPDKVVLAVTLYPTYKMITAATFPFGQIKYCTAKF